MGIPGRASMQDVLRRKPSEAREAVNEFLRDDLAQRKAERAQHVERLQRTGATTSSSGEAETQSPGLDQGSRGGTPPPQESGGALRDWLRGRFQGGEES